MVNLSTANKRTIAGSPEPLFNIFKNRNRNIGANSLRRNFFLVQEKSYVTHILSNEIIFKLNNKQQFIH